ncbi:hypothetical protein TNCV_1717901 [Trichonephila clavipes]|nr:hypothetical protein TNCV_1717901 [Trichonephila clavipes]
MEIRKENSRNQETSKNISYTEREARKLILPQISQTYSRGTKSSTTTITTQTDDSITKIVCPPLKLLQPLTSAPKPTMPSKIPTVTKSSTSTEAQLLPSASLPESVPIISNSEHSLTHQPPNREDAKDSSRPKAWLTPCTGGVS